MGTIVPTWYQVVYYKLMGQNEKFKSEIQNLEKQMRSQTLELSLLDVLIWPWVEMMNHTHADLIQSQEMLNTYSVNNMKNEVSRVTQFSKYYYCQMCQ
jgi:hypothetical protein